jgi:hypothetical protein
MLHILLRLDHSDGMAEAFVLDDGCMAYPLVLAEDPVGKRVPFPSNF